jgi:hypothetical protein
MHHYAFTKTGATVQIHMIGPFAITYVNPADDPSRKAADAPLRWTLPPVTASAAAERDLNNRTPNSQRSIRMAPGPESSGALICMYLGACDPKQLPAVAGL